MQLKSNLKRWNTWRWTVIYFVLGGVFAAMIDQMRFDWKISSHYLELTLSGALVGGTTWALLAAAWCMIHNRAVARHSSH